MPIDKLTLGAAMALCGGGGGEGGGTVDYEARNMAQDALNEATSAANKINFLNIENGSGSGSIQANGATSTGLYSFAEGESTSSGYCSHSEGFALAEGAYSHAEGSKTVASKNNAHAEGFWAEAQGKNSHAEGYGAKAIGDHAHAEGFTTEAQGNDSHAEGFCTKAIGDDSHAEGYITEAQGIASHAEGENTKAIGLYSHAEGLYTKANGDAQHVFGKNNIPDEYDPDNNQRGRYVEIVGNGQSDEKRSNARTLDWSGNEVLAGSLTIGGNEQLTKEQLQETKSATAEVGNLKSAVSIGEYIYFTDGFLWSSSGALSANASYCASKQLMTIDPEKPWLKLTNYESDRVDLVFFDASGTFISPRQSLYNDSPLFINVVDKAPEGAAYFSVSIRKTTNKPYAKLITAEEWVGEYNGYVDTNGKICIGIVGSNVYKMKILPVHSGDVVSAESSANSNIDVIAFYDYNFGFINGIQYLAADITNYKAIAPVDGYAIASSTTASFNDFALSIEPVNNNDTDIVPDNHYPYYINNGTVTATETYYLSNCIVVPAGKVLMVSANCGTAAAVLSDGQTNTNIATGYGTTYDYWVSCYAPETKIVRICWRPGYGDGLKAYTTTPNKRLNGKSLYCIGDSYFAGNNLVSDAYARNHVWPNLLALRNNMTINNYGVNGTTIAECSAMSTATGPANFAAVSDRIDFVDSNFDVFVFEGGSNDYSNAVPLGDELLSNTDRETFHGAMQYIINKVYTLNPSALIFAHPCWVSSNGASNTTTGLTKNAYQAAFMSACARNGVPCVPSNNNGVAVTQASYRAEFMMASNDASHFNIVGHAKYVLFVEKWLDRFCD